MVYIDELVDYSRVKEWPAWKRRAWCHLLPDPCKPLDDEDALAELRAFAVRLGLNPKWEQRSGVGMTHFDLTEGMRAKALRHGAVEMTRREWGRLYLDARSKETHKYHVG